MKKFTPVILVLIIILFCALNVNARSYWYSYDDNLMTINPNWGLNMSENDIIEVCNIVPYETDICDIGSDSLRFGEVYVAGPSIYLGEKTNRSKMSFTNETDDTVYLGGSAGGIDDCTMSGTYTGTDATAFSVIIDGTGTPDTFTWSKGGVVGDVNVPITGSAQFLSDGISATFVNTTGHKKDKDSWLSGVGYRFREDREVELGALSAVNGSFFVKGVIQALGDGTEAMSAYGDIYHYVGDHHWVLKEALDSQSLIFYDDSAVEQLRMQWTDDGGDGELSFDGSADVSFDTDLLFLDYSTKWAGIGTTDPKSNLHILTSGTSGLGSTPADRGVVITGQTGKSRLYFENVSTDAGKRVFEIINNTGVLSFDSLNDAASSFTNQYILALDHDTGNVGIGTGEPEYPLHVTHASAGYALIETDANSADTGLLFRNSAGENGYVKGGAFYKNDLSGFGKGDFHFALENSGNDSNVDITDTIVTILHEGYTGFGTYGVVTPAYRTHSYHATEDFLAKFQSGDSKAGILLEDDSSTTGLFNDAGIFSIDTDNSGVGEMTVNTSGVGIVNDLNITGGDITVYNASSASSIALDSGVAGNAKVGEVDFQTDGTTIADIEGHIKDAVNDYGELRFSTKGSGGLQEWMYLDEDGEWGLGIEPQGKAHIYEDTTGTGIETGLTLEQDGTGDSLTHFVMTGAGTDWTMGTDNSATNDPFSISSGNDLSTPYITLNDGKIGMFEPDPQARLDIHDTQAGDLMDAIKISNESSAAGSSIGMEYSVQSSDIPKAGEYFKNVDGDSNGRGDYYLCLDQVNDVNPVSIGDAVLTAYYSDGHISIANNLGVGTATIPHNGIGEAMFALEGTDTSAADGPHIQITTDADDYPLFQMLNVTHDDISMSFDAYLETATWKSSDAGSNFHIHKLNDRLKFRYDSGVAQGGTVGWNEGFQLDSSGNFQIGDGNFSATLDVVGTAEINGDTTIDGDLVVTAADVSITATNDITLDNQNVNGSTDIVLGANAATASFNIKNNSLANLLTVDGAGDLSVDTDTLYVDASTDSVGINRTPADGYSLDVQGASTNARFLAGSKNVTIESGNFGTNTNTNSADLFFNRNDVGFNQEEFVLTNKNNSGAFWRTFKLFYTNDADNTGLGLSIARGGKVAVGANLAQNKFQVNTDAVSGTGTVTISGGSVTGSGTAFESELKVGDYIIVTNGQVRITVITDNTTASCSNTDGVTSTAEAFTYTRQALSVATTGDTNMEYSLDVTGDITQNNGESVQSNPTNVYTVTNATDLYNITVAMGTAGTFTVGSGEEVVLHINATDDFISNVNYSVTAGQLDLIMNNTVGYIYTGTSTFMTALYSSIRMQDCFVAAYTPGTQLLNIVGFSQTQQFWSPIRCTFVYFDLGNISNIGILGRGVLFVDWKDTLEITDVSNVLFNEVASNQPGLTPNGKPMMLINTSSGDPAANINIITAGGYTLPTDELLRFEPNISNNARISLTNFTMTGTIFDESGSTVSFTAVADATITAQAIASVTDSSGVARFNWTPGATVYVGQEVVTSSCTNSSYNGTNIATSVGVGWFEVSSIAYVAADATCSLDSDSVTITSTAHGLSNLTGITLDTTSATDYDGGATIYNSLTNTFQANRTWTATYAGSWSTKGLNQEDPRVILTNSPAFENSHWIANGYVNDNTTGILGTAITNNVYRDMVFGTAGSALVEDLDTERWKLIDDVNSEWIYTGNEPFHGKAVMGIAAQSSGSALEFVFGATLDDGGGYSLLNPTMANEIANSTTATPYTAYFTAYKGYKFKPQFTRSTGTSGIVFTHFIIDISQ